MKRLADMHDGFFDGLWMSENKSVYLFLRTSAGERSTVVLKDVKRMDVSHFKAGNIVFDVVVVDSDKLTADHIEQLCQFSDTEKLHEFLRKARERGLRVLEVNPSFGAECTVLFRTAEILSGHVLPPSIPNR